MTRHTARAAGALLILAATACTFTSGADEGDLRSGSTATMPSESPSTSSSTLPDPGVTPATSATVTYTPPTAVEPFEADLCRPATGGARDVGIILVHGGGGIGGDRGGVAAWASSYVAAGYTTLAIDYLLFSPGGVTPVFPRPEQNMKAAVQYLRGSAPSLGLDPHRIVVQGFSAGARLGAVAYTSAGDDRFVDGELWPSIDDTVDAFVGFYGTYDGSMQYDRQYYGGRRDDPDPDIRADWIAADVLVRAGDPESIHGPAAFFTGALDWAELITQQEELAARVRAAGYDATTSVAVGGEHGYDAGPTGLTAAGSADAATLVAWLDATFPQ